MLNRFVSTLLLVTSVFMFSSAIAASNKDVTFNGKKYEFVGHKTEANMSSTLYFYHRKSTKEPHSQITAMNYKASASHNVTDEEFNQFITQYANKGISIRKLGNNEYILASSENVLINGLTAATLKITYMAKDKHGNMSRIEYKETLDADAEKALLEAQHKDEKSAAKKIEKIIHGLVLLNKDINKKA